METLKKLLQDEVIYQLTDELMNEFLKSMTEIHLKSREILISYGQVDDNIYVIKDGIIRYCYFDGDKEKTFGFGTPGSVSIQYHCYRMHQPSIFQLESCGRSVVMKISKKDLDSLIERSPDCAKWMLSLSIGQLYTNEMTLSLINGLAKERCLALLKNRPEIIADVPLNIIASYLGVTPPYLSKLRRDFFRKK
jgi:CRP-like cAMP-binding protein